MISPQIEFKYETLTLVQKVRTFFEAKLFCELNGAMIYQPKNMTRYEILTKFASEYHLGSFWIGISDEASKGTYLLVDGDHLPEEFSRFWASGQPNHYVPFI